MIKRNDLRAEKVAYPDGIGCCIWRLFSGTEEEGVGICWDFSYDELDDIIALLEELKTVEPEEYKED